MLEHPVILYMIQHQLKVSILVGFTQLIRIGERFWPNISLEKEQESLSFDKVGIGTTNVSGSMFRVGAGSTLFAVDAGIVTATGGIHVGDSAAATVFKNGNATFSGIVTASSFVGNGANLTNIKCISSRLGTS